MTERMKITGTTGSGLMGVGDVLVDRLVEENKLPYDFDFRALGVDEKKRDEVVRKDVLAALGFEKSSGEPYLDGPLPNCVFIPLLEEQLAVLQNVAEDYYRLANLNGVARNLEIPKARARREWAGYIAEFNPELYEKSGLAGIVRPLRSRDFESSIRTLSHVVIRDEALTELYERKYRKLGQKAVERRLLHYLLLDNHMELGLLD